MTVAPIDLIKPIETRYAGCRFRSRLEARWAVFFDALNVEWRYEPEGFMVAGKPYLPDFWLPQLHIWVEVKGVLDEAGGNRLLQAVDPVTGLPGDPDGTPWKPRGPGGMGRMFVLGDIPKADKYAPMHSRLDFRHGEVVLRQVVLLPESKRGISDCPVGEESLLTNECGVHAVLPLEQYRLEQLMHMPYMASPQPIADAYHAARMARFEHGESGAPPTVAAPAIDLAMPSAPTRKRRAVKSAPRQRASTPPPSVHEVPALSAPLGHRLPTAKLPLPPTFVAADIRGQWPEVIRAAGESSEAVAAMLPDVRVYQVRGRRVTLSLFDNPTFDELQGQAVVKEALQKVLGGTWQVESLGPTLVEHLSPDP